MRKDSHEQVGDGGVEGELRRVEANHGAREGPMDVHASLTDKKTQHHERRRHLLVKPVEASRCVGDVVGQGSEGIGYFNSKVLRSDGVLWLC